MLNLFDLNQIENIALTYIRENVTQNLTEKDLIEVTYNVLEYLENYEKNKQHLIDVNVDAFPNIEILSFLTDKILIPFSVTLTNNTFQNVSFYRLVSRKLPSGITQRSNFSSPFYVNIGDSRSFLIQIEVDNLDDLEQLNKNDIAFVLYSDATVLFEVDFAISVGDVAIDTLKTQSELVGFKNLSFEDFLYFSILPEEFRINDMLRCMDTSIIFDYEKITKSLKISDIFNKPNYIRQLIFYLNGIRENSFFHKYFRFSIFRYNYYGDVIDQCINVDYNTAKNFYNRYLTTTRFFETFDRDEYITDFDSLVVYTKCAIVGSSYFYLENVSLLKNCSFDSRDVFMQDITTAFDFVSNFQDFTIASDFEPELFPNNVKIRLDLSTDLTVNDLNNLTQYIKVASKNKVNKFNDKKFYKILGYQVKNMDSSFVYSNDMSMVYSLSYFGVDSNFYIMLFHSKDFMSRMLEFDWLSYFDITDGKIENREVKLYDIDFTIGLYKYDNSMFIFDNSVYIVSADVYLSVFNNEIYNIELVDTGIVSDVLGSVLFDSRGFERNSIDSVFKIRIFNNGNKNLFLKNVMLPFPKLSLFVQPKDDNDYENVSNFYSKLNFDYGYIFKSLFSTDKFYDVIAPSEILPGEFGDIYFIFHFSSDLFDLNFSSMKMNIPLRLNFSDKVVLQLNISGGFDLFNDCYIDINQLYFSSIKDLKLKNQKFNIRKGRVIFQPTLYLSSLQYSDIFNYETAVFTIYDYDDKVYKLYTINKEMLRIILQYDDLASLYEEYKNSIYKLILFLVDNKFLTHRKEIKSSNLEFLSLSKLFDDLSAVFELYFSKFNNSRFTIRIPDDAILNGGKFFFDLGNVASGISGYFKLKTKYPHFFKIKELENISIDTHDFIFSDEVEQIFNIADISKNKSHLIFQFFNYSDITVSIGQNYEESFFGKYVGGLEIIPSYIDLGYVPFDTTYFGKISIFNNYPFSSEIKIQKTDASSIVFESIDDNPVNIIQHVKFNNGDALKLEPYEKIFLYFKVIPERIGLNFYTIYICNSFNEIQKIYPLNIEFKSFVNNKPYFILDNESRVIDFGTVPIGESRTKFVTVHNIGNRIGKVNDIYLVGNDSESFKILDFDLKAEANRLPYNKIVKPNTSLRIPVKFVSQNYGFNSSYVYIELNEPIFFEMSENNDLTHVFENAPKHLTTLLKGVSSLEDNVLETDSYIFLGYVNPIKSKFRTYNLVIRNTNRECISQIFRVTNTYKTILRVHYSDIPFNDLQVIRITLNPICYSEGQYYDELVFWVKTKKQNDVRQKYFINKIPIMQYVTKDDHLLFEVDTNEIIFVAKPYLKYYKVFNIYNYGNVDASFFINILNDFNGLFTIAPNLNNHEFIIPEGMNVSFRVLFGGSQEMYGEYKTNLFIKCQFLDNEIYRNINLSGYIGDYNFIKQYKRPKFIIGG